MSLVLLILSSRYTRCPVITDQQSVIPREQKNKQSKYSSHAFTLRHVTSNYSEREKNHTDLFRNDSIETKSLKDKRRKMEIVETISLRIIN